MWGEAILTATYLYNRTPSSSINFKTPYFLKYKEQPNINNIRVFSSLTYYKEPTSLIKKLDPRATPYYLIGFIGNNIYKLYNLKSNKVVTSRDCVILEDYFYKPNNLQNIREAFSNLKSLEGSNIDESITLEDSSNLELNNLEESSTLEEEESSNLENSIPSPKAPT